MLTKQEAENLMKIEGEVRGMSLKVDWDFILEKKGEQGLKKVEAKMAELGYLLKHKEIEIMNFYPIGLAAISLLTIEDIFKFNEEEIKEWGASAVKFSIFTKVFMKYFGSLELIAKEVPKIWKKHYTVGKLTMPEFSEKKRYAILKLENFKIHPIFCNVYKGYFSKVAEMIVRFPTTCKETKCMFRGDKYHEFLLTW